MSSREEKLAAARKKLKEFQGKNKDSGNKNVNNATNKNFKNTSEPSNESSPSCTPVFDEKIIGDDSASLKSGNSALSDSPLHRKDSFNQGIFQPNPFTNSLFSEHSSSGVQFDKLFQEQNHEYTNVTRQALSNFENDVGFHQNSYSMDNSCSYQSGLLTEGVKNMYTSENKQPKITTENRNGHYNNSNNSLLENSFHNQNNQPLQASSLPPPSDISSFQKNRFELDRSSPFSDPREFFNVARSTPSSDALLNDVLQPLQAQLRNHVQTISILVGERNDLQKALNDAQSLISKKSGEVDEINKKLALSNSKMHDLESRLIDLDNIIKNLSSEKEELTRKSENFKSEFEKLKVRLESKEEEESELKQRLEAKNREYENLSIAFRELQNQLNMCQIKIQQLNTGDSASSGSQIVELQIENQNLKQKIVELEKIVEFTNSEKEQSSQNFHVYAQQCNTQISALNSQLNELTSENQKLEKQVESLRENIQELKLKQEEPSTEKFEVEIADLHRQISVLSEANSQLELDAKEKEQECAALKTQLEEKIQELNDVEAYLKEVKSDNTRLLSEMESSNANERLLAAMESDKVAAARAVSQNQKLKEQILELEGGFVKLSHEKLELTDRLAHEKHVNKELQARLESMHHHDHDDDDHCHHDEEKEHPVNDSDEIEELRNIIRQLQDDKAELLSRLNQVNLSKTSFQKDVDHVHENCTHDTESVREDEEKCENSKLLLRQMEEKVKKTMSEIAVLDEEKQKLEHLVLQLQGETETIGEYISLYQKQRMLLRQRTKEKDEQLIQLSRDKEELRSKLTALDELVQSLLTDKNKSDVTIADVKSITQNAIGLPHESEDDTAGKIRALITEIGSTNLVNNHAVAFEHCSCCSGRLINI